MENAARFCRPSKLNFSIILCLTFMLGTYIVGMWSIKLQSRNAKGSKRYHIIASLNWNGDAQTEDVFEMTEESPVVHNNPGVTASIEKVPHIFPTTTSKPKAPILIPGATANRSYSCKNLIAGDMSEQQRVLAPPGTKHPIVPPEQYVKMTKDCNSFRSDRAYTMQPLSEEEANFPIAYSILMFKEVERFERLLRAIYRSQNYYCIHVDAKSPSEVIAAVSGIASCFDNVFMASRFIDVKWAYFSVLEPELVCMEQLWKYKKWKYFINLTGQEFPLKTNGEIVQILKTLNGANNMEGTVKRRNKMRTVYVHNGMSATAVKKSELSIPVTLTKGSVHIIAQRGFIDYILHNKTGLQFRDWVKDTGVPDETFFTSLNYSPNLGVPGAYLGTPETDKIDPPPPAFPRNPFIARFKNWGDGPFNWKCGGQRVRMVCIFGVKDLPMLTSRYELFANKFYSDYQVEAYDCLEELHFNRTRQELDHGPNIDLSFYEKLDIVHNHVQ